MSHAVEYGLENLLALDGDTYIIHESGYWVRFEVKRVASTPERPHGIQYSLTMHGPNNERLIGFDNAHGVRKRSGPVRKGRSSFDHSHRFQSIRPYMYENALKLIDDFWKAVDDALRERTGQ